MISSIIAVIFTVVYWVVTLGLCRGLKIGVREQVLGGLTCSLTLVLECIMIPLPTGSSIAAGSIIPIMVLALCYDHRLAFVTGWITGILALMILPVWKPVHWAQFFVEHMICFSCLGYVAVFGTDKKWKVLLGSIVAISLKTCAHIISGVIFFSQNAWDGWGAWGYSIAYNLSANIPEGIIGILVLMVLPISFFRKVLQGGKYA